MAKNRLPKNAQITENAEGAENLKPLGAAATNTGQFVLNSQKTATESGFSRVSQLWYDKTKPMDWARETIANAHANNADVDAVFLKDVDPIISPNDGEFVFKYGDKEYMPTPHALNLLAGRYRAGNDVSTTVSSAVSTALLGIRKSENSEDFRFDADRKYKELFKQYVTYLHNDSKMPEDPFFWRFNNKLEQVRAVFSSQERTTKGGAPYRPINNEWLLEVLTDIVGNDGRISHWRGENPDTIRFNILVPDAAMEDNGENYGGGISVGNSEIGELMMSVNPFTFRAICMNGCIWDRLDGEKVRYSHRSKSIDMDALAKELRENIRIQLDMVPKGIEMLLGTKRMKWEGCSELPMFTKVGMEFGLAPVLAQRAYDAYRVEIAESDANRESLYGLTNALSRAAQGWNNSRDGKIDGMSGANWESLNRASGDLMNYDESKFNRLVAGANLVSAENVAKYFGPEAIAN